MTEEYIASLEARFALFSKTQLQEYMGASNLRLARYNITLRSIPQNEFLKLTADRLALKIRIARAEFMRRI